MTGVEVQPDATDAVTEPDDAQAEADFAGGFDGQTPEEPTGIPPPATEATPTDEALAQQADAEPTDGVSGSTVSLPGLDDAQIQRVLAAAAQVDALKATVEKLSGTAFGKIGGIERTLKQLQEATPVGQSITVSVDAFEELKADFPELAEMTVKGLNRALSNVKGTAPAPTTPAPTPTVDPAQLHAQFDQKLTEETRKIRQEAAMEVADLNMPGWRDTVNSDPFKQWFATQGVADPDKPSELKKILDQFATYQKTQAKPKPPATNSRRDRIAAAVSPRGVGGPVASGSTDEDEFQAGFAGR